MCRPVLPGGQSTSASSSRSRRLGQEPTIDFTGSPSRNTKNVGIDSTLYAFVVAGFRSTFQLHHPQPVALLLGQRAEHRRHLLEARRGGTSRR